MLLFCWCGFVIVIFFKFIFQNYCYNNNIAGVSVLNHPCFRFCLANLRSRHYFLVNWIVNDDDPWILSTMICHVNHVNHHACVTLNVIVNVNRVNGCDCDSWILILIRRDCYKLKTKKNIFDEEKRIK